MPQYHLSAIAPQLESTLEALSREKIIPRIWNKDHTVWCSKPREITNRLGWLDLVSEPMQIDAEIEDFVASVQQTDFKDAVLLGMGGSSLGARALRESFDVPRKPLDLHILDSTHSNWVQRIRARVDPKTTLFLVASKSGTTTEVLAFLDYFWHEVEKQVEESPGQYFVAITDSDTPLAHIAKQRSFRKLFISPADVGGRFSVLSHFGLVAAALTGTRPKGLINRGHAMADRCRLENGLSDNPGAWLGATIGAAAKMGRNKLTLLTSEKFSSFGLWIEQLLAESTGKDGKGIIPVINEPFVDPRHYGNDRFYVSLRYGPESEPRLEEQINNLVGLGEPLVDFELWGLYELGSEYFRWEFATAVAAHLLGIHPFNQPNVDEAKLTTNILLEKRSSKSPTSRRKKTLIEAFKRNPRYVALMAYTDTSPEFESAIAAFRSYLLTEWDLCSTFGYGPRFLHSTGQLHKGGPEGGLFIQFTSEDSKDLQIPSKPYGFNKLIRAQADGDFMALVQKKHRCIRVDLGENPAKGLTEMTNSLLTSDPRKTFWPASLLKHGLILSANSLAT